MDLDQQLRAAHQRRLASARSRLADRQFEPHHLESDEADASQHPTRNLSSITNNEVAGHPKPKLSSRVLAIAAGLLVVVGGAWAVTGPLGGESAVEIEVGSGEGLQSDQGSLIEDGKTKNSGSETASEPDESAGTDQEETLVVDEPEQDSTDESEISESENSESEISESEISESENSDSEEAPSTTNGAEEESASDATVGSTTTARVDGPLPELDQGVVVDTSICPSGRRAPLERASLRYIGENTGWMRMVNLVDEQDGPYYFKGWEPGYGSSVTVELGLRQPVLVSEIRLAQDSDTAVSGLIAIGIPGDGFNIELDGVGGWKSHQFDVPVAIDTFTINRQSAESNVMEVIVCVAGE